MKEELISGLKNAVERGFSLDSAVSSFINAGYNPSEVNEAASYLSQGATSFTTNSESAEGTKLSGTPSNLATASQSPSQLFSKGKKRQTKTWLVILLGTILILLLLGIVGMVFFKDQIYSILSKI